MTARSNRVGRRWWALAAVTLALVTIGLDQTVLNLALPTLSTAFHASESELQWFVTSYTLALAAAMLPAGLVGDRFGRKTVLVCALGVFAAASLACAYAPSSGAFIAARTVLGVAGAALIVMSLSVITVLFSEAERPRAMGIWAAGNFLALPLGPIVGGWVLSHAWWGWVFLLNVPVALVGLAAVVLLVPESRSETRPGFDLIGLVASSAGLTAVMYGLVEAGDNGWGSASALVPFAGGVAALVLFGLWEMWLTARPGGRPLVDVTLFRSRTFTWGILLTAIGVFGMFGILFALPQYLQAIRGMDAQGAGLRFLPAIAGMVAGAIPADRMASRLGPKLTVATGFAILAAGLVAGATMSATTGDPLIAGWTFVVGLGSGLGLATAASAAVVELSAERSGVGSALLQAVIKLGPAFGATILGSVLNSTYQGSLAPALGGVPPALAAEMHDSVFAGLAIAGQLRSPALTDAVQTAFVAGIDDAMRLAAVIAICGGALALVFLPRRSPGTVDAGELEGVVGELRARG